MVKPVSSMLATVACVLLLTATGTAPSGSNHEACTLTRVHVDSLSPQDFDRTVRDVKPIILTGATSIWPAAKSDEGWANRSAFVERYGSFLLPLRAAADLAKQGSAYSSRRIQISEYMTASSGASQDALFSNVEEPIMPALRKEFDIPTILDGVTYDNIASVGHGGTGVPFHRHFESWLAVFGRKRWWLLPPAEPNPPVRNPCDYTLSALAPSALVCDQQPGEILFIPSGWWHATCNLGQFVVGVGGQGLAGLANSLPALHRAALDGSVEDLEAAIDVETPSELVRAVTRWHNSLQPVHLAAKAGHLAVLQWLHARGASLDGARDETLFTPLHWAVQRDHVHVVDWLLKQKVRIDSKDSVGIQPVQYSCYVGGIETLELLLARGANPRPPGSQTCEDLARSQGHAHMVRYARALNRNHDL